MTTRLMKKRMIPPMIPWLVQLVGVSKEEQNQVKAKRKEPNRYLDLDLELHSLVEALGLALVE